MDKVDQEKLRKVAINSSSGGIVAGMLMFFFANDATSSIPFVQRVIAATVAITASLVAARMFFAKFKF